jgi:hypothetical protein
VAPVVALDREALLGQVVDEEAVAEAALGAAEVAAGGRRHLEEDAPQAGVEDGEEERQRAVAVGAGHPLRIGGLEGCGGDGGAAPAGVQVEQFEVVERGGVPVQAVERDQRGVGLPPAEQAVLGQDGGGTGGRVGGVDSPGALVAGVVDDAPAAVGPLLARLAMGVLALDVGGEHPFLAGQPVADADGAGVGVHRRRAEVKHPVAVGALGRGDEVGVQGMGGGGGHDGAADAGVAQPVQSGSSHQLSPREGSNTFCMAR